MIKIVTILGAIFFGCVAFGQSEPLPNAQEIAKRLRVVSEAKARLNALKNGTAIINGIDAICQEVVLSPGQTDPIDILTIVNLPLCSDNLAVALARFLKAKP